VFTQFQSSLNDLSSNVSSEEVSAAAGLMAASTEVYADEKARFDALKPWLDKLLQSEFINVETTDVRADGVIVTSVPNLPVAYRGLWELKNEIGCGGSDPVTQGSYSYRKYWGAQDKDDLRSSCCCPSFIIAIAGPWMCILGAVFVTEAVIEPLTDYIWLGANPLNDTRLLRVARLFKSLAAGLRTLHEFYTTLQVVPSNTPLAARLFPHVCSYTGPEGEVRFRYLSNLMGNKAVFKAQTEQDNRLVVVKFAYQYHDDAHRALAAEGFAPRLFYAGPFCDGAQTLSGVPKMVVMEHLSGSPAHEVGSLRPSAFRDVQTAVDLLHKMDIVFGDLRRPNIMVLNKRAKLVDFDWCGKHGVGRYPLTLNNSGEIKWHQAVGRGSVMDKEHDLFMLGQLRPNALDPSLEQIVEDESEDVV